jgi:uncharacterized protein YjiS (DUF1127 family)
MHGIYQPIPMAPAASRRTRAAAWLAWLGLCLMRRRERLMLQELSDDQLRDIGLSRADVERECRRWPWDGAPER